MKPSINEIYYNQYMGMVKGIGTLSGIAFLAFLRSSIPEENETAIVVLMVAMIIFFIGSMGYFYSTIIDFEIVEEHNKSKKRKAAWRQDEWLYLTHLRSGLNAGVILGLLVFFGAYSDKFSSVFNLKTFCWLALSLYLLIYFTNAMYLMRDEEKED